MFYYYNDLLHSFVVSKNPINMNGWREISEAEYNAIKGYSKEVEDSNEDTDSEVELEEETVDTVETVVEDPVELGTLASLMAHAAESGEELPEVSKALQMDASILSQEEKAASNIFESIKDLREFADKDREARVVKGKSHGVYTFEAGAWSRVGDL